MAKCSYCNSSLAYTTYIRTLRRNPSSHRSKQVYVPAGILCLDCGHTQPTLDLAIIAQIRNRRNRSSLLLPDPGDQKVD